MGEVFGRQLREHREALDVSGYAICKATGLQPGNLSAVEKGRRSPSPAMLEALAGYEPLRLTRERLQTWLDLDLVGEEGVRRLAAFVPGVLEAAPSALVRVPDADVAYPPTPEELALMQEADAVDVKFGPLQEPGFWDASPEERRRAFLFLEGLVGEARQFLESRGRARRSRGE